MENKDSTVKANSEDQQAVDPINQNIESILAFYKREEQKLSRFQLFIENITNIIGQPYFLGLILIFVALWVIANQIAVAVGWRELDPAPYFALQGDRKSTRLNSSHPRLSRMPSSA